MLPPPNKHSRYDTDVLEGCVRDLPRSWTRSNLLTRSRHTWVLRCRCAQAHTNLMKCSVDFHTQPSPNTLVVSRGFSKYLGKKGRASSAPQRHTVAVPFGPTCLRKPEHAKPGRGAEPIRSHLLVRQMGMPPRSAEVDTSECAVVRRLACETHETSANSPYARSHFSGSRASARQASGMQGRLRCFFGSFENLKKVI